MQRQRPEVSLVGSYYLRVEEQDVTRPNTAVGDQTLHSFDLNYLSVVYPFELFQRNVVVALNYQRLFDLQSATDVVSGFTSNVLMAGSACMRGKMARCLPFLQRWRRSSLRPCPLAWPSISGPICWIILAGNRMSPCVARVSPPVATVSVAFEWTGRIEEDYAFSGFNVTAGFLWRINSLFTLGGVFRSPFRAEVTRQHASTITVIPKTARSRDLGVSFRETLDMDMPLSYGLGLAARLSDSLTLSLDVTRYTGQISAWKNRPVMMCYWWRTARPLAKEVRC